MHKEKKNNFHSDSVNQNNSFWVYHETLIKEMKRYVSSNTNNEMPDEFKYYLNQIPIDITECPLKYWQNYSTYSLLPKLAKRYLTVIATSVPSERLFS